MNNTFNLNRFTLLLKRQWLEFGKIFLITLLVATGVIVAFYGLTLFPIKQVVEVPYLLRFRDPLFLIFGFLFISVISSAYFAHLGQKSKAIIDLLIPASTFEKFLTGVFYTSILSVLSFILVFLLTDFIFISYIKSYFQSQANLTDIENIKSFFARVEFYDLIPFYTIPFLVTSIFMLGSIYFNRFHYIKTAIILMIFNGLVWYILMKASDIIFSGKMSVDGGINTGRENSQWISFSLIAIFSIIAWVIGYIRLKEKEV